MRRATAAAFGRSGSAGAKRWPLARRTGACLHYDAAKHLTCFSYRDETGAPHTVRFAGLRSWMERLRALEQAASRLWRSAPRIQPFACCCIRSSGYGKNTVKR